MGNLEVNLYIVSLHLKDPWNIVIQFAKCWKYVTPFLEIVSTVANFMYNVFTWYIRYLPMVPMTYS